MKNRHEWMEIRDGSGSKSKIEIKAGGVKEAEKNPKIIIINHERREISRFDELKDNLNNRAVITLDFVSNRGPNEENEKGDVEYWFTRLKPKDEAERKSFEKEAHIDYLINNGFLNKSKEFGDMTWVLKELDGKLSLEIKKTNDSNSSLILIKHDKIEVKFDFFLTNKVNVEEVTEYDAISKAPYLTKTRMFFISLVLVLLFVIIFFRKKIWKWIKGETKQEKKVQDQLDIF